MSKIKDCFKSYMVSTAYVLGMGYAIPTTIRSGVNKLNELGEKESIVNLEDTCKLLGTGFGILTGAGIHMAVYQSNSDINNFINLYGLCLLTNMVSLGYEIIRDKEVKKKNKDI